MMRPERWQQVKEIFHSALALPPDKRHGFLAVACQGHDSLRREVESLISSHEKTESFIDSPAYEVAAQIMADEKKELQEGQTLGSYKIIKALGAGGMGEVYLAHDSRLNRQVALKVLPAGLVNNRERLHRFAQEAQATSALNHPNIITIYEVGSYGDTHFIATEFIDGVTLHGKLQMARVEIAEALNIATQTAAALDAAHRRGIVHRDIKPENIMVREDGLVKVLDFGLAKLTEQRDDAPVDTQAPTRQQVLTMPGTVLGTARYMSPEQARGKEVDARTDIWSLGVVLYEMLAGKAPFAGETTSDTISAVLSKHPLPLSAYCPDMPKELERLVGKTLRKDREERYHHIKDLLIDLKDFKQELEFSEKLERSAAPSTNEEATAGKAAVVTEAQNAQRTSRAEYIFREIKQHKRGLLAVFTILLLAAMGSGYWFYSNRTASTNIKQIKSIAVLPLKPINTANRDEIYEIGIADSLIYRLSSMKGVVVRPLSATRKYADINQDPVAAGKEQQVDYVLASNYQLAGGKIRITAQLFDVASGQIEETYKSEKDAGDIFAMQDAIAGEIGNILSARFGSTSSGATAKRGTTNEEAYRLYLQGMYLVDQRSLTNARKAVELFEQAVRLDPNYAQGWAGKAHAHRLMINFTPTGDIYDYQKAMEAINKALALDENLADAHSALCENKMYYEYDFDAAERSCKRAIELASNSSLAHQIYSRYLVTRGRIEDGMAEIKTAIDLEPTSRFSQRWYGNCLTYARRHAEAVTQLKRVVAMDESFGTVYFFLWQALGMQGNYDEAFEWRMKTLAFEKADEETVQSYRAAYQTSGWQGVLREDVKRFDAGKQYYYRGAALNAQAGNKDKAFEYLEKSYQRHELWFAYLQVEPRFDSLRDDPRFDEMVKRVGLMP